MTSHLTWSICQKVLREILGWWHTQIQGFTSWVAISKHRMQSLASLLCSSCWYVPDKDLYPLTIVLWHSAAINAMKFKEVSSIAKPSNLFVELWDDRSLRESEKINWHHYRRLSVSDFFFFQWEYMGHGVQQSISCVSFSLLQTWIIIILFSYFLTSASYM